jgi:hypothetical protein
MKHRTSLRNISASDINSWSRDGDPFVAAHMEGIPTSASTGRLDGDWAKVYNEDLPKIVYTVLSYWTPIAWKLQSGEWVVPDQRHSPSTSRHQGVVRGLHPQRELARS